MFVRVNMMFLLVCNGGLLGAFLRGFEELSQDVCITIIKIYAFCNSVICNILVKVYGCSYKVLHANSGVLAGL